MGRRVALTIALLVWPALLSAQTLTVTIEVQPGDPGPKSIEPQRGGMMPVAILTTREFDAAGVDPDSIRLGPKGTEAYVFKSMLEDVDRDNDVDRLLLVPVKEMAFKCGDTQLRLTGKTTAGRAIEASAVVRLEGCPTP